MPGEDYIEYGRDVEKSVAMAKKLEAAGYDGFLMGNGSYDSFHWLYPPMYHKEGLWLDDFTPLTAQVDVDVLQERYRKRLGQRLMASIRDESGKREVLAHGSEYVVVECCNDQQALKAIRRRIQSQVNGLDNSADKVNYRIRVLDRFLARFRRTG